MTTSHQVGGQRSINAPHPIQRRYLAEQLVRLRRADEQQRYAASQRQGRIDPNPHQIDAVIFALKRIPEGGCILADEVGLGKTIEAGLIIAQLRAEGFASRILLIVPKPLLGQWQDELYRLFGIQAAEGTLQPGGFSGSGVFLVGREIAGSERGAAILRDTEPFDLCVIDEAHEVFANIYRRYDTHGSYRSEYSEARTADRVRSFLRQTPVLLLTATPIQNNLTELWGLVQYVEPTGTLLGNLRTFRDVFCDGDDRKLIPGQEHELRRRIETIIQRTLRRQAQEFLERPFVNRHAQIFEYSMTPQEKSLYDDVTAYLLEPQLLAFRGNQRQLLLIGFHRLMASSVAALASSLRRVAERLERMLRGDTSGDEAISAFIDDLEEEDLDLEGEPVRVDPVEPSLVQAELERVQNFIARAETLPRDSKADKLLEVLGVINERPPERRRVVIFTESLVTQAYLSNLFIQRGGYSAEEITLFSGVNDSPRANQALQRWQQEIGDALPPYQHPSRSVALRLALVHEFKTRSRIFISTEAGAKGLNLQFCDTIINYDLPWNPQRIEQRIGRCHRYSQEHDVTVINFLAADNEAQRLTFEILSRKLDLFGKVLDASDVVLHEPSTDSPEKIAGALGNDFEGRLRRIYERARTIQEIEAELRRLREEMDEGRKRFEETWSRTAGLIETRFDQRVKQVFRRLQADLPEGLARLDSELDQLITGFLGAKDIAYRRVSNNGHILFELSPSIHLPDGWRNGGTAGIGHAKDLADADPLHLGHPLVHAAVEEARAATAQRLSVTWTLDESAPLELQDHKNRRGRLVLTRIRYDGFEPVERLIPVVVMDGGDAPLDPECGRWLLERAPSDRPALDPPLDLEALMEDATEQMVFADQADVAVREQERFDRNLEQIERYVEDQLLVLRRRLRLATEALDTAEDKRDAALGSEARTEAESRVLKIQKEIDELESQMAALQSREDAEYERWREHAFERRYRPPAVTRILDVELQDVALKILHTADWHLGRRFPSFSDEDERKLTRSRIEAVDRLLGLAESFSVNAVLCAGDLFDEPAPPESWWRELARLFERRKWHDRPVFLLPGNHDPLEANSVWSADHPFRRALPPWVHVVDRDDYQFQLSPDAVLCAAPCRSQAGADDLAMRLPRREPGDQRIRIGLVHGQTFDIVGHQTNFPIASDAAEQRGLTYLAIGDTHGFRELPPRTSPTVYPGTPEPTTFGEKETGFVAVVFFPRQGRPPIIQKHSVGRWRWRDESCASLAGLEALQSEDLKDCVVRLRLAMSVTFPELDRVERILTDLKGTEAAHGKAGIIHVDRSALEINVENLNDFTEELPDVLRSVANRLQEMVDQGDGVIARQALYHLYRTVREARQ